MEDVRSREAIFGRIVELLGKEFEIPAHEITPQALLGDDLDLDSVDAVALAVRLEEETGLTLGEDDLKAMRTVQDIVDVVHRRSQRGS